MVTDRTGTGWDALGDGTRRAILACLARRPHAVGELAALLPVSRPAVSQHLKVLKDAGLVAEQADGTRRIYRLDAPGVAALRDQLDAYWRNALDQYADVVDSGAPPAPTGTAGTADSTDSTDSTDHTDSTEERQ